MDATAVVGAQLIDQRALEHFPGLGRGPVDRDETGSGGGVGGEAELAAEPPRAAAACRDGTGCELEDGRLERQLR